MQIVIDIDVRAYNKCLKLVDDNDGGILGMHLINAVANGTPLPKGHGRLIDADDIKVIELEDSLHIIRHCKGDDIDVYIDVPTIIEADKESEE